jgi:hypothetical protein
MAVEASVRSEDVLTLLATVPERVTDLVAALEPPELGYRHAPAFPTLQELVGHLCQAGGEVDALLRRAYLDGQRELRVRAAIDPIADPDFGAPLADQLESFARVRRRTVDLLRGLDEEDWQQPLVDAQQGELSLLELCTQLAEHELAHLSQLRNLIAVLPAP